MSNLVLAIPEPKLAEACANASRNIMLSANDHAKLNELVEILEPFRYVNDQLQAEKTVTSSLIIPYTEQLITSMTEISDKYSGQFTATLRDSVSNRLKDYLSRPECEYATFLDPRFRGHFISSEGERTLKLKAKLMCPDCFRTNTAEDQPDTAPPSKKTKFLTMLAKALQSHSNTSECPWSSEVTLYKSEPLLEEDACPLSYWQLKKSKFPILSQLAQTYLACPASSAPVERLFSAAGKIFSPERCRLGDKMFDCLFTI